MSERTFNPASADIDLATDATCQDCGKERWEHRDGGMVYGLVCPARSTPAEAAQGAAPLDPDERYLRLREVSELLDLPSWDADARTNRLGIDEFQGARWLASWLGVKIAALDWLRSTLAEALDVERLAEAVLSMYEWDEGGGCRYCTVTPHHPDCVVHLARRLRSPESDR